MRIGRTLPPAASPIPLIDILKAFPACLRSSPEEDRVEEGIRRGFNCEYVFLFSSGKAALASILVALKVVYPGRDQVLLPAFTCYSVPAAVKRAGLQVKLCDLAPGSLDLDRVKLGDIIELDRKNQRILCVLPTHLYGCPTDVNGIRDVVGPDIPLVEDAAQGMGEVLNSSRLGTIGDVGFFSLDRGKAVSAMGGGVIVTSRRDVAEAIRLQSTALKKCSVSDNIHIFVKTILTAFLQRPSWFWLPKSISFLKLGETLYEQDFPMRRLSAYQVGLVQNWETRLKRHQDARRRNVKFWLKQIPAGFTVLNNGLGGKRMVRFAALAPTKKVRDYIIEKSEQTGLGLMAGYPSIINKIPEIMDDFAGVDCPCAEDICSRIFTIPVHEYVKQVDNEQILLLLKSSL